MHSRKVSPLTVLAVKPAFGSVTIATLRLLATVPLPPHVKSSSNPRCPAGGATRHHMHHHYPLCLRHRMAFHDRPRPPILPWLTNPFLCLVQCLLDWCMYSFQVWFTPVYVANVPHQEGEDPSFQHFKNCPQLAKHYHRHFWTRPQLHKQQHCPFAPSCRQTSIHGCISSHPFAPTNCNIDTDVLKVALQAPAKLQIAMSTEASYPIVWDSGASVSEGTLTMANASQIQVKSVSQGVTVSGQGMVLWYLMDTTGMLCAIQVLALYIPEANV